MKKITTLKHVLLIFPALFQGYYTMAQEQVHRFNNPPSSEGYIIEKQDRKSISINYVINQYSTFPIDIKGKTMQNLALNGVFMPNEAGAPNLPGNERYIAIPQGSKAVLKVISFDTETIKNIDIAPAPVIPLEKYDNPLVYEMDNSIYSKNAFYPENPVKLSEPTQIRGVDVVSLGVMPFQYNPVTKELIVYKNIKIEVTFIGGNSHFGNDAYRSRWWDPIMEDILLNSKQLLPIDYNITTTQSANKTSATNGCEYAIIIPNGADFAQWADSIKKFRTEQGILTEIYKLSDIGSTTVAGIQAWVKNAYNNWTIKPAAMLILADFGSDANTTITSNLFTHIDSSFPAFASDNFYGDVNGDDLPEIVFARITANNAAQLKVMCSKFLSYERNPPTDASFYDKPITATGWQDDRWFQLGGEIFGGYLMTLGKHPVRVNALGSPANNTGNNVAGAGTWSTTNATTIINYFGPNGLKYVPANPGTLGGFANGNSTGINTAVNNGAFMLLHRDHGFYSGWGEPAYSSSNIASLKNVNNKMPFVFSINCQTGAYHRTSEVIAEKFHRYTYNGQNSGALGVVAAAEVSYSFANDTYIWGMFDNMWPKFMPAFGSTPVERDKRPAFGSAAGKYFLKQSSWTGSSTKQITYRLFHMFGDAFQWMYSEVPKNLTVSYNATIGSTDTKFSVSADVGSFIALTIPGPNGPIILGTAVGTGASVSIPLSQPATTNMLVTVTKQDYFRYSGKVVVGTANGLNSNSFVENSGLNCFPNPFNQTTTISYHLENAASIKLSVVDMLGKEVALIVNNVNQVAGLHEVQFDAKNLASGIYSCILKTDSKVVTKNIIVKD